MVWATREAQKYTDNYNYLSYLKGYFWVIQVYDLPHWFGRNSDSFSTHSVSRKDVHPGKLEVSWWDGETLGVPAQVCVGAGRKQYLQSCHWLAVSVMNGKSSQSSHPFSSVQFSRSVVSDSLRPHESHQARPPCPSPTPGLHSDSRPSSQWCHPAISSSVVPFSSCPQSLQHQSLVQWVSSLHEVAKVLEFKL